MTKTKKIKRDRSNYMTYQDPAKKPVYFQYFTINENS